MSSPSIVRESKKDAILQLCNFLCANSVTNITDLADGEILVKTIQTTKSSADCSESKNDQMNPDISKEQPNVSSDNFEKEESNPAKEDDNHVLLRFNYIQKFIDSCYEINSADIVQFSECTKLSELDLTIITLFVLSEITRCLIETNNETLQTLCHLDIKYQIELEDIFKLFISERHKITRDVVEELLSKSAKTSLFTTPRRTSLRLKSPKYTKVNEDIFTSSPLKDYFQASPVFKAEDFVQRDKQLKRLTKILHEGEEESALKDLKLSEMEKELQNKENHNKQLHQQILDLKEDIKVLQMSCQSEVCKTEKDRLIAECNMLKNSEIFQRERVEELNHQLLAFLEQKKSKSPPNKVAKALEKDVENLNNKLKILEVKNHAMKKQLSEIILTDLKEKKSSEYSTKDYEDRWHQLQKELKEIEDHMLATIENECKTYKEINELNLQKLSSQNQLLCEEIQELKKKSSISKKSSNRRSNHLTYISVATETENIPISSEMERLNLISVGTMTELMNIHKIPEIEKFRHIQNADQSLLLEEPSLLLNTSDNFIPCEQSSVSSVTQCPEQTSNALLWAKFDTQKIESENSYINFNHDSVLESSYSCGIDDVEIPNVKIKNSETEISSISENKYVLGNYNFENFLNELKKLTKNGSFEKVLQVFRKFWEEINITHQSNKLDLQKILQMLTNCVCTVVSLNIESSCVDKCCMTDEFLDNSTKLEQLKNYLSATSEKYEKKVKDYEKKLAELNRENKILELKFKACEQKLLHKNKNADELTRKCQDQSIKLDSLERKYKGQKETSKRLLETHKKQANDYLELKSRIQYLLKKKIQYEHINKQLKQQNDQLMQQLKQIKEEKESLEKKISNMKDTHTSYVQDLKDSHTKIPNHSNIKPELHSSIQDTANESALSGAFHKNKSISYYISENEDDFHYHNSLDSIKKDYQRVEELKRRNSLLPLHLQSAYPIEADLNTTYESFYMNVGKDCKEEQQCRKKRKLGDMELGIQSSFVADTSVVRKAKKRFVTPPSLRKLLQYKPRPSSFTMKSKP